MFPGFDEPGFKTPFDIAVTTRTANAVVGNTPVPGEQPGRRGPEAGQLATTLPLPTYLIALAVGPLDIVEGAPLPPNARPQAAAAARGASRPAARGPRLRYALENTHAMVTLPGGLLRRRRSPTPSWTSSPRRTSAAAWRTPGAIIYGDPRLLLADDASFERPPRLRRHPRPRAGPPVVRRPGDAEVVGRHLAERVLRQLDGLQGGQCLAARAALRRGAGAADAGRHGAGQPDRRAPDPPAGGPERRHRQRLRRDHLPQGRRGARHVRELAGRGQVSAPASAPTCSASPTAWPTWRTSWPRWPRARGGPMSCRPFAASSTSRACRWSRRSCECGADGPALAVSQSRYLPVGSRGDPQRTWQLPVCVRHGTGDTAGQGLRAGDDAGRRGFRCRPPAARPWSCPTPNGAGYYRFALDAAGLARAARRTSAG